MGSTVVAPLARPVSILTRRSLTEDRTSGGSQAHKRGPVLTAVRSRMATRAKASSPVGQDHPGHWSSQKGRPVVFRMKGDE